ncbi:hypothetical protein KEM55_001631, partial [Ascosphaera atra]
MRPYEPSRQDGQHGNPDALSKVNIGVDVEEAERDFAELNRIFTEKSTRSRAAARTLTQEKSGVARIDIEHASADFEKEDEPFDLEEVLRGYKQAEIEAGIRPKNIGVLWDNLTVRGIGGEKTRVRTFPDAIVDFCNVPGALMEWFGLKPKGPEVDILKGFRGLARPDLLLKMFNIEHTRDTIVGNQFIRGISGGERKRVSIAEMMVTQATVLAWDNSTRGLDSSTALDFVKSLRIMTDVKKTTTFVSLYQASENIYHQFDKVLLLDEGRQVFFGRISEARSYFEGLGYKEQPRQTTPDYLTGCTDPFERQFVPGRTESD